LEFMVNPCSSINKVNVTGVANNYLLIAQLPNYEAFVGDEVIISPKIVELPQVENENIKFTADFYFNPTVLYPIDYQVVAIDKNLAKIKLENLSLEKQIGESLIDLRFKV